ncbi:MAG: flagellar M-ring protein FliF [Rhodoferax sp.]|nr:flagellar M-ring protein FliF [Rhodoferax sp.]MBP9928273.1 flagellar M-ring protein FliF [Rhodoferax sp.]HQZ06887.1 flagellar basal-body MS-ring/collar protein FliF [Burkholderiaceae bacterium]HRA61417.1 flagellar basal-body MS-ring/collar protein FliF [Burkholderiaceae bacterium]
MNAVVATLPANVTLTQRLSGLGTGQRMRLAIGAVIAVAIVIAGIVMGGSPDWRVLYANLADKDGGAIIAQLSQMNIPYKHADGGSAILVPADKVHDTRLRLASQGLPKGSVTGFEMMESNRFGMTQFQERLTFQRGLEGELTRSIQALSSVQSARVHLALPNQNGFFREQQKPSASVLVSLYPARSLDRAQIAGIVHLVASSVAELSPSAVSVLDDTGKLLSTPADGSGDARGVDAEQLQYTQNIEQSFTRRILDILEPIVGKGNARAQVTADIDFSQTESTSESHRPNQTPDSSAIRSQQLVETGAGAGGAAGPSGVPGAVTNQPPGNATAPINGPAQTLAAAGAAGVGGQGATGAAGKRESIINYEVDKTVRVVRGGTGQVRRLSAAVVVNHQAGKDADGKLTSVALTADQIEKMTALVRETIGFNKERGDSVNLMNAPFAIDKQVEEILPLWRQPEMQDLARSLAWPIGTVLLVALVLLGLVRPGLKAMARPVAHDAAAAGDGQGQEGGQLDALVADSTERPPLLAHSAQAVLPGPTEAELRLEGARKLARENPVAVANIVKGWMGSEAPA